MGIGDKLRNLSSICLVCGIDGEGGFVKLGGREKTDGRLSNTKKCVTKNRRRTLGDDLKTCSYNIYGYMRYYHWKKLGEEYMVLFLKLFVSQAISV